MTASFWSLKRYRSSATKPKVDTKEKAIFKVRENLQKQLGYWKDGRGKNEAPRALWFKKMDLRDGWLLKIQMQTSAVFIGDQDEQDGAAHGGDIAEKDMEKVMQELISDITANDEKTWQLLGDAYDKLQNKKAEQKKERLEKKQLQNEIDN